MNSWIPNTYFVAICLHNISIIILTITNVSNFAKVIRLNKNYNYWRTLWVPNLKLFFSVRQLNILSIEAAKNALWVGTTLFMILHAHLAVCLKVFCLESHVPKSYLSNRFQWVWYLIAYWVETGVSLYIIIWKSYTPML